MYKLLLLFSFIPLHRALPPGVVLDAFKQKFPFATEVKWSKENVHVYEVEFKMNNIPYSANFNEKGLWIETETPIGHFKLPEIIKNSIHQDEKIKQIFKIEKADGTINFEVEILKGMKTLERFFDQDGNQIKS